MAKIALMLPKFSRYGGVEGFGYTLSQALARAGYRVDFICAKADAQPPEGVEIIKVGRKGLTRFGKLLWFLIQAEVKRKAGGYDLCISLGKSLNQDMVRMGGGPLEPFWRLSGRAYGSGAGGWWKMFRRRTAPVNMLIKYVERRQARSKSLFIANSHKVLDWLVSTYPQIGRDKVDVIYNKPDLDRFYPPEADQKSKLRQKSGIAPAQVLIATAGTNFRLKGVATAIKALAMLPENHVLTVAGGRNPQRYLKLAKRLGVEDRIIFPGRVDDMASFYQAADVFILPTFYDSCSNAVLEAMACGLPVISTSCNGSSVFLEPGMVLDDPADHRTLASLIEKAANQKSKPFEWPDDKKSGIEPYLELVQAMLENS